MLRTTCLLSLRLRDSRRSMRTRTEATYMGSDIHWTSLPRSKSRLRLSAERGRAKLQATRLSQRALHLLDAVGLDDVADLEVVVAGDLEAAFEAFAHLARIFLETLERIETDRAVHRRVDDHAFADDADLG